MRKSFVSGQRLNTWNVLKTPVLTQYDTLRGRLGGIAIVALNADGVCTGCHVSVSRSNIMRVNLGNVIVKCESCRRMLCVPQ